MTINILEYIKNNFEELLTMLISTIITISVIMQRTKINRKVKDMQKVTLEELTIEELENELERRKNLKLNKEILTDQYIKELETDKIKRLETPLVPKYYEPTPEIRWIPKHLIPKEKTEEEIETDQARELEKELKKHQSFVSSNLEIYKAIKESLNILKHYTNKYKYKEEVEKELNENE